MHLSNRLDMCLQYTKGFIKLADIGTDHAMLPIAAVTYGYVHNALAIDNKLGPYLQAQTNIKKHGLTHRITALLGDGLSNIDDDTDVVVISGMGGDLMANIMLENPLRNVKRLILQPNRNVSIVRDILHQIEFKIVDEVVLEDQGKLYEIIIAEQGNEKLSDYEIAFGPINLQNKPYYFIQKVGREYYRLLEIVSQIPNQEERNSILKKIQFLEEVLRERE